MRTQSSSGFIAAMVAATLLGQGCATSKKEQALPSVQESNTVTATATVQSVDLQTRRVTLIGKGGKAYTFIAGPEVRNLDRVAVGDTVKVKYTESLALAVKRSDGAKPELSGSESVERAKPGQKPGGVATTVVAVSAKIVDIDRTANRVTLVGPEGNERVLLVQDPKNLEGVQVGDMVHATYTESVGISVEPVAAAPKQ
jgi:hypothetical protein